MQPNCQAHGFPGVECRRGLALLVKLGRVSANNDDKAFIRNNEGSQNAEVRTPHGVSHIRLWTDKEAFVEWTFNVKQPGQYVLEVVCSVDVKKGSKLTYGVAGGPVNTAKLKSTGGFDK